MKYKRVICFDFDDTLCHTAHPDAGKITWKEKKGTYYPHVGWWSKKETLDLEVFETPLNPWVHEKYLAAIADPENYVVVVTGRIEALRNEVEKVLVKYDLKFNKVYLNTGGDTFRFKTELFKKLIDENSPEELIIYDDRHEHLLRFAEWSKTFAEQVAITIIDVKKKKYMKNR